jgi:parvulin-like peptidyl-prolyl isomerase
MKRTVPILLLAVLLVSAVVFVQLSRNRTQASGNMDVKTEIVEDEFGSHAIGEYGSPNGETLEKMAEIEREMMDTKYHTRVEGDKIILDTRQVDAMARNDELLQNGRTRDDAADLLAMETLLLSEAKRLGLQADGEEIQKTIQNMKDTTFNKLSVEAIEKHAQKLGMTLDEYLDAQYDAYYLTSTLANYWQHVFAQAFGEGTRYTGVNPGQSDETMREQEKLDAYAMEHYEKLKSKYAIVYE